MLHQQLNESPSPCIPGLPVVVGCRQGSMHIHSHQITTTSRRSRPVQPKKVSSCHRPSELDRIFVGCACGSCLDRQWHEGTLPHQTVSTYPPILPDKDTSTAEDIHGLSWCDLLRITKVHPHLTWGANKVVRPKSTWIRKDSGLVGSWNVPILYVPSFQVTYIEVEGWWCHSVQT